MTHPTIATAADYADALLTARRFKTFLFFVVLLALLLEVTLFFLARYDVLPLPSVTAAATQPVGRSVGPALLQYLTVAGTFVGMTGTVVLSFVLLLIATIMLVGRLIGVGRITSAYLWCVLLGVLLFPWQSVLLNPTLAPDAAQTANDFRVPGVLYTWQELSHPTLGAKFDTTNTSVAVLRWARFVAFPLLGVLAACAVQVKSNRALRQALGEATVLPDEIDPNVPVERSRL